MELRWTKLIHFSYIRALYNLFVCLFVALVATYSAGYQKRIVEKIKSSANRLPIIYSILIISVVLFAGIISSSSLITLHPESYLEISLFVIAALVMSTFVAISVTYFVKYDDEKNTTGLTVWSLAKAKEMFKGSKLNDREGEKVKVSWKPKEGYDDIVYFSNSEMKKMQAEVGDLVYLTDARKWLGGLKSVHSVFGEPHNEDGVVYITSENLEQGQFIKDRKILAEKEM